MNLVYYAVSFNPHDAKNIKYFVIMNQNMQGFHYLHDSKKVIRLEQFWRQKDFEVIR